MELPGDEHEGWDRLITAVLDGGRDDASATTTGTAAAAPTVERTADLVRMLDLAALHAPAGATAGDGQR